MGDAIGILAGLRTMGAVAQGGPTLTHTTSNIDIPRVRVKIGFNSAAKKPPSTPPIALDLHQLEEPAAPAPTPKPTPRLILKVQRTLLS